MFGLMDCNNFFVSCERLFRPDLLKRPVAVLSSNDGCIVARSQEIKDLGIPMGVPYFQVKDVLTKAGAVLFSSNFTLYRDISARVMHTLETEVGLCDIYSIDEAFFEVHDDCTEEQVLAIRSVIMKQTGMPVSIGVAKTKTLAKQASVIAKKSGGACVLHEAVWAEVMQKTSCGSVWGLGRKTSEKLTKQGITTVAQFVALDRAVVLKQLGVVGVRIQSELQGTAVYSLGEHQEDVQQSIMSTRSFEKTTSKIEDLESAIGYHVTEATKKLREKKLLASSLTVMILPSYHSDFFLKGGRETIALPIPTSNTNSILKEALFLIHKHYTIEVPYKKAGVVVGGLIPEHAHTESLFTEEKAQKDTSVVDSITDILNVKFGMGTIQSGVVLGTGARGSAKLRSKEYTTNWKDIPIIYAK